MIQKEQIRIHENGAIRAEGHTVFRWFWSEQLHGVVVHPNAVAVLQMDHCNPTVRAPLLRFNRTPRKTEV